MANKAAGNSAIPGGTAEPPAIDPATLTGTPGTAPGSTPGIIPAFASGIAPAPAPGAAPTETGKRARGRPPGSKNKGNLSITAQPVRTAPLSVDSVSAILFSIHGMLAGITRVPEMKLDPQESKQMATAIAEVAKHYDLTADPKMIAWVNLGMTAGAIYGSRFVAISMRKHASAKKETKRSDAVASPDFMTGRLPPMDGGQTVQ